MEEVRSAAAMAGYCDPMKVIHDCSVAFHAAKTPEELDEAWKLLAAPVYSQLSEQEHGVIERLHALTLISMRMK